MSSSPLAAGLGPPHRLRRAANGRRVTTNPVADGTVVTTGTMAWWAIVAADALHAHGSAPAQPLQAGTSFTMAGFDILVVSQ